MNRPGTLFPAGADARAALRRAGVLTGAGVSGLIPALVLVGTGLTGQHAPRALVHPILVLGGLAVSFASSFVAVTHWELRNHPTELRFECWIRKRPADLVILFASLGLLAVILIYSFLENYQPR